MFAYQGKTALVTGASSGIGRAFVHALAARKMNLILVARSTEVLQKLAKEISEKHQVQAAVITADLSLGKAAIQIAAEVQRLGLRVDLLVNNAGFMTHGHFETIAPAQDHNEVMVNVASVVGLSHAFLPAMLARRDGAIINVASVAGFQPIPYLAVYSASKAFVISFSMALWEESRRSNVRVQALCPGTTDTPLFELAGADEAARGSIRTPEQVVATSLRGLERSRPLVVDGAMNRLLGLGSKLAPRWLATQFAGKAVQPRVTPPGA